MTGRVLRRLGPTGTTYVRLRHGFIDDRLAAGAVQVVLLGAGDDTRGYRFADQLAGRRCSKSTLPPSAAPRAATIAEHKAQFPTDNVVGVGFDYESQTLTDVLPAAGFTQNAPNFFAWEGAPMYLTGAAVTATLDAAHELRADGSQIAQDTWHLVDNPGPLATARPSAPAALSLIGEPVTFGVHPEEYEHFLGHHG